jgi:hypothetical protein
MAPRTFKIIVVIYRGFSLCYAGHLGVLSLVGESRLGSEQLGGTLRAFVFSGGGVSGRLRGQHQSVPEPHADSTFAQPHKLVGVLAAQRVL